MTWIAPEVDRVKVHPLGGEREMLEGWLNFHRQTLLSKCAGLTPDQLKQHSCAPSALTLLGLVRHMAEVERWWFRMNFAGEDLPWIYASDDSEDADFDDVDEADAGADFAAFDAEVAAADAVAAGRSLDDTFTSQSKRLPVEMNLRWVYTHMIEEYARHNGHADLLRERIDGKTGS